ncbi:MAG: hypothetical protein HKN74_03530 [Acidimicrobiia bacterium]|nr:hypothetical protein [Acidimicrobiia bacterium]
MANQSRSRTRVVGPTGVRGLLEFGPAAPGPLGEVLGLIEESKVVLRYLPWGSLEPGRHSLEVHYEGTDYVLVSRGARRPTPHLETSDGTPLAAFSGRRGKAAPDLSEQEAVLVALIAGSGIADITRPQTWAVRH